MGILTAMAEAGEKKRSENDSWITFGGDRHPGSVKSIRRIPGPNTLKRHAFGRRDGVGAALRRSYSGGACVLTVFLRADDCRVLAVRSSKDVTSHKSRDVT